MRLARLPAVAASDRRGKLDARILVRLSNRGGIEHVVRRMARQQLLEVPVQSQATHISMRAARAETEQIVPVLVAALTIAQIDDFEEVRRSCAVREIE